MRWLYDDRSSQYERLIYQINMRLLWDVIEITVRWLQDDCNITVRWLWYDCEMTVSLLCDSSSQDEVLFLWFHKKLSVSHFSGAPNNKIENNCLYTKKIWITRPLNLLKASLSISGYPHLSLINLESQIPSAWYNSIYLISLLVQGVELHRFDLDSVPSAS